MAQTDNLVEKYSDQMVAFFRTKLAQIDQDIEKAIAPFVKERAEIMGVIENLEGRSANGNGVNSIEYATDLSAVSKAVYFTKDKWLTLSEISDKIADQEPGTNKVDLKTRLSAVLAMEVKKEPRLQRLIRKQNEDGKWIYKAK